DRRTGFGHYARPRIEDKRCRQAGGWRPSLFAAAGIVMLWVSTTGLPFQPTRHLRTNMARRRAAAEFELALLNLGVNARDAMPNGGRFRVEAHTLSYRSAMLALRG